MSRTAEMKIVCLTNHTFWNNRRIYREKMRLWMMNVVILTHWLVKITRRNEPKCAVFKLFPWFESVFIFLFYSLTTVIFSNFSLYLSSIIITLTMRTLVNTCKFISNTMTIHLPQSASQLGCVFIGWWLRQLCSFLWNGGRDRHICQSGKVGWGGE